MNLRVMGVTAGSFLLSIYCLAPGVDATSRTSGSIVTTGPMTEARFDHAAVLLPTGRVLIVGGIERNGVMQPSAELFDPTKIQDCSSSLFEEIVRQCVAVGLVRGDNGLSGVSRLFAADFGT